MASILFYFIASYSEPHPKRSTLWITAGAAFFFLIHVLRTYIVGNAGWNHLSESWFILGCSFIVYSIIALFLGAVWHEASADPSDLKQLSSSHINHRLVTLWFPYGVALVVSVLLLMNEISFTKKNGTGLLPIVLLLIAILSRQMLIMWDNLQLSEKLTGSNTNLENNVMERTQHLAILHSITSTLNSSLDKNSVLTIALEQIMVATNAEQGAIWLRHSNIIAPDKTEWHLAYAKGFPSKDHEDALRVLAIETVDDEVILNSKTQSFFQTTYGFPSTSGKFLAVPIRSGGLLLGVQALVLKSGKTDYDTRSVVESVALEVGTSLQNAQLYLEARQRADRDGVTNLLNHRAIQERLTALLRNSQKTGEPFSVLMMDLNDFKYFNDTYGHPVGDDVLRNVAMQLKKIGGTINPVGRYGGDEFIILMPGQDHEHARQTYQTLLETMEQEHFEVAPGVRIPLSMSYGWSVFPDDGKSALELITIADANLYRYKQRGELEDEVSAMHRRTASAGKSTAFGVLDALITAIDNKDHYTRKHSDEVAHYALMIAEELGYSSESLRAVRISGLLHDVGKIAVPDDILRHPGKLSQSDWEIMKQHPTFGALIVKDLPYLEDVISGIRSHHERWDGRGYPDGLSGMQIPIMGRLLAVPDTYSALTTNRPYRKGHTPQEALLEIRRSILTQFDPLIAKTFIEVMKRELRLGDLDDKNAVEKAFTNS
jgi:diguanylate cyclase (GGDEF)-like protein/putative nucleotidyltransferase with HDIG domain